MNEPLFLALWQVKQMYRDQGTGLSEDGCQITATAEPICYTDSTHTWTKQSRTIWEDFLHFLYTM
uniref:Uncharacterized protein n=1 Tax=Arundo donax TaxID=35708 RepID=A0A0A9FNJ4_ARUDO